MTKFNIEVDAWKIGIEKDNPYYGTAGLKKEVSVTEAELYEAITKHLQVKGFFARTVSVEEAE